MQAKKTDTQPNGRGILVLFKSIYKKLTLLFTFLQSSEAEENMLIDSFISYEQDDGNDFSIVSPAENTEVATEVNNQDEDCSEHSQSFYSDFSDSGSIDEDGDSTNEDMEDVMMQDLNQGSLDNSFDFRHFFQDSTDLATETSLKIYRIHKKHRIPRDAMDAIFKEVNKYIGGSLPPLMSTYRMKQQARENYPLKTTSYHICKNSCMMFNGNEEACKYCKEPRFISSESTKPRQTMSQLSLKEQLALAMTHDITREEMEYRSLYDSVGPDVEDIFGSPVYQKLQDAGLFRSKYDIALGLYVDGFKTFKKSNHSMTIIHFVNLNLPPTLRKERKSMIQIGLIPSYGEPKDLFSFLQPLMDDLKTLQNDGVFFKTLDGETIHFRAHLLFATDDIPAAAKLCGHIGHMAAYGCRICKIKGSRVAATMSYPPAQVELRKQQEFKEAIISAKNDSGEDLEGQIKPSLFADDIASFHGVSFFALDQMHLLSGVGKQLWKILTGHYNEKVQNSRRVVRPLLTLAQQKDNSSLMVLGLYLPLLLVTVAISFRPLSTTVV